MGISLKSKITQKILNFFFIHQEDHFYINELSKILNEDCANLYRQLLKLLDEGMLCDEFKGNQRYFFLNTNYRFLNEYKTIINQTFGLEAILKDRLSDIKGIEKAIIFGSYASNQLTSNSDLDILIVGNYDVKKLAKIFTELQKE
jgi:predicted nucleotidyltransferase